MSITIIKSLEAMEDRIIDLEANIKLLKEMIARDNYTQSTTRNEFYELLKRVDRIEAAVNEARH